MGIESLLQQNTPNTNSTGIGDSGRFNFMDKGMYPMSQIDRSYYATPSQLPLAAQTATADYDPSTNPLTGEPTSRFARGGIAALRFAGEDGSQVEEQPSWDPESGQVKLQTIPKQGDRDGEAQVTDYKIPKDQIRDFASFNDPETGKFSGAAYTMKDGSTLGVDKYGIVQQATPSRNDYKLNEQGYYQPVGANLTWDGGLNQLTKKIGGVDVLVPGQFHKGGYQDDKGNLRVDENGVPIPLLPNYLDSGMGKSGLADAAPYITAAMMAAATMGASAPASAAMLGGEAAFAGMVPASETLLGSMGYLAPAATSASAFTPAEILGGAGGTYAPTAGSGASFMLPEAASSIAPTVANVAPGTADTLLNTTAYQSTVPQMVGDATSIAPQMGPTYAELGYQGAGAKSTADAIAAADAASKAASLNTAGMNTYQKLMAGSLAMKALGGSGGSAGGGGSGSVPYSTTTTTSVPQQQYPQQNYPQQQQLVMSPYMTPMNTSGAMYNPLIYSYNTRRAAQGGVMYGNGGGISTLGSYSDGGRLLKGPGDGMSDNIPAKIGQHQPAALADGEFVVPADVVSHLGNGSTDAGAKQLYKMMDQIRQARTGRKSQGKKINPNKFLPKE